MANGTNTGIVSPTKLDTVDYQKKVQSAAAATRATGTPPQGGIESAKKAAETLKGTQKEVGKAAVSGFEAQATAQKQQAEKAASALEMVGSATLAGVQNLERIQSSIRKSTQSATESWGAAAAKADEYVQKAGARVQEVLTKLDQINEDFTQDRSFAKAHAMQSSVQATIGSMRDEERNILQNYGADSPEFQQFQASKRSALATVQSNIHASFQQMAEAQHNTYLNVVSDAYTKSNMYLGFQEQQHVEMLKYRDQSKTSYELQTAQLDATLEQMKMQGMENLSNWIVQTPSFTMDMAPLMTMLSDLKTTQDTLEMEGGLTEAQTKLTQAEAQKSQTWADYLSGQRKSVYGGR